MTFRCRQQIHGTTHLNVHVPQHKSFPLLPPRNFGSDGRKHEQSKFQKTKGVNKFLMFLGRSQNST